MTDIAFANDPRGFTNRRDRAGTGSNEQEAGIVGLFFNAKKTELQVFNHETLMEVKVRYCSALKIVEHFKYLGAWMQSTEKDMTVRKVLAWSACHKLRKV